MPGILFLCLPLSAPAHDLAWDLFEEGNWPACSAEAQRLSLANPTDESLRFLVAATAFRLQKQPAAITNLAALAHHASSPDIRALASLELARLQQHTGHPVDAWNHAASAFVSTTDSTTFLHSLALMQQAYRHSGVDVPMSPALEMQYLTCEKLLRYAPDSIRPPRPDSLACRLGRAPGRLIVGFYRRCIRPALGNRCSLSPNCSEYFLQASRRHGLLGIPMIADRLVREPSVVASARHPSVKENRTVYLDPVDHHDFWMEHP